MLIQVTGESVTQVAPEADGSSLVVQIHRHDSTRHVVDQNRPSPVRGPWGPHNDEILTEKMSTSIQV